MLPVSQVFYTVVTVSIGLVNLLNGTRRVGDPRMRLPFITHNFEAIELPV